MLVSKLNARLSSTISREVRYKLILKCCGIRKHPLPKNDKEFLRGSCMQQRVLSRNVRFEDVIVINEGHIE